MSAQTFPRRWQHAETGPRRAPAIVAKQAALLVALHLYGAFIGATTWSKGVFFPALVKEFHLSHAAGAALLSINTVLGGLVTLACGWMLVRRVRPGPYLAVSSALVGIGYAIASTATGYGHLIIAYVILSAGAGNLVVVPFVITDWFKERRGLALAAALTGSTTGGVLLAPLMAHVVTLWGWRFGYQALAAVICLVLAPLLLLVVGKRGDDGPDQSAAAPSTGLRFREALATRPYWALIACYIIFWASSTSYLLHFISALMKIGYSTEHAAWLMSLLFLLAAVTKFGFGHLADRLNTGAALAASLGFSCIGMALFAAFIAHPGPLLLGAFIAVYGLTYSAPLILFPLLVARTFGRREFTAIDSTVMVTGSVVGSLGSVFTGWVFDRFGSYWPAFATFSAILVAATLLAHFASRRPQIGAPA